MRLRTLLFVALLLASTPTAALAQSGEEYVDPDGKFKIKLQGDWKAITYSDEIGRAHV